MTDPIVLKVFSPPLFTNNINHLFFSLNGEKCKSTHYYPNYEILHPVH